MTSWAVVCDVYFLEPQTKHKDESSQQFAERVQKLIASRAKLHIAPWDGYLKYYNLGDKVGPVCMLACPAIIHGVNVQQGHVLALWYIASSMCEVFCCVLQYCGLSEKQHKALIKFNILWCRFECLLCSAAS